MLVDGVTKLDKVKYGDSAQAETVRKMIVAMSKDIRVLLIKLADRLHNARTWGFVPAESAPRKATETLEIYAPLAHRLGIQTIKWELEDLSFAVLLPEALRRDREPRASSARRSARSSCRRSSTLVDEDLQDREDPRQGHRPAQAVLLDLPEDDRARPRLRRDLRPRRHPRARRTRVRDCYAVLGAIHARWTPLPGRFKDYIATPKFNLYQSLHTTVIGPRGARSRSRSARTRCTSAPSSASRRTGSTRSG